MQLKGQLAPSQRKKKSNNQLNTKNGCWAYAAHKGSSAWEVSLFICTIDHTDTHTLKVPSHFKLAPFASTTLPVMLCGCHYTPSAVYHTRSAVFLSGSTSKLNGIHTHTRTELVPAKGRNKLGCRSMVAFLEGGFLNWLQLNAL